MYIGRLIVQESKIFSCTHTHVSSCDSSGSTLYVGLYIQ